MKSIKILYPAVFAVRYHWQEASFGYRTGYSGDCITIGFPVTVALNPQSGIQNKNLTLIKNKLLLDKRFSITSQLYQYLTERE